MDLPNQLQLLTQAAETKSYHNYIFVKNTFASLKHIYLGVTTIYPKDKEKENEFVYRARVHYSQDPPIFNWPSELSYRRDQFIRIAQDKPEYFGRAHLPYTSMFYGSVSAPNLPGYIASMYEAIKKSEKREHFFVTVGVWKLRRAISVSDIFAPTTFLKYNPDSNRSWYDQLKIIQKNKLDENQAINALLFNRFLSNEFAKEVGEQDDHLYLNSAYYSHLICNKTSLGGILYASRQVEGAAYNLALTPSTVDSSLYFCGARRFEFYFKNGEWVVKPVNEMTHLNKNGQIVWVNKNFRSLDFSL